jgi:hypothetical protein
MIARALTATSTTVVMTIAKGVFIVTSLPRVRCRVNAQGGAAATQRVRQLSASVLPPSYHPGWRLTVGGKFDAELHGLVWQDYAVLSVR